MHGLSDGVLQVLLEELHVRGQIDNGLLLLEEADEELEGVVDQLRVFVQDQVQEHAHEVRHRDSLQVQLLVREGRVDPLHYAPVDDWLELRELRVLLKKVVQLLSLGDLRDEVDVHLSQRVILVRLVELGEKLSETHVVLDVQDLLQDVDDTRLSIHNKKVALIHLVSLCAKKCEIIIFLVTSSAAYHLTVVHLRVDFTLDSES